jgi:hypothetical protein
MPSSLSKTTSRYQGQVATSKRMLNVNGQKQIKIKSMSSRSCESFGHNLQLLIVSVQTAVLSCASKRTPALPKNRRVSLTCQNSSLWIAVRRNLVITSPCWFTNSSFANVRRFCLSVDRSLTGFLSNSSRTPQVVELSIRHGTSGMWLHIETDHLYPNCTPLVAEIQLIENA